MRIYLDHNATTPLCSEAAEAMMPWLTAGLAANPSSVHEEGRAAREAVEHARARVAEAIGAGSPKEVVFTSGATEANAMVLSAIRGHAVTTTVEHPSILDAAQARDAALVGVDIDGALDLLELDDALRFQPSVCSVILANNETGVIQDAAAIRERCIARGVPLHFDASQALGKIKLDVRDLGCDYATFSAHKVHGPTGVGALWIKSGAPLEPILGGGHQERGRRAGTENLAGIVGFGAAAARAPALLDRMPAVEALRDRLWEGLSALGAARNGDGRMLPNTLSARFDGCEGETMLMALDLAGVAVSVGSACSAGSLEPSHVLLAMEIDEEDARRTVRFSLGAGTTTAEIERTLMLAAEIVPRVRVAAA